MYPVLMNVIEAAKVSYE